MIVRMDDNQDFAGLPNRGDKDLTYPYSIKLNPGYRQKIRVINGYKDGLTDEIRKSIEKVVDVHWERLQAQLKQQEAG
jgi:hypothetical protein